MKRQLISAILASCVVIPMGAQQNKNVPRLVVGITIDRLRSDYLDAFSPLYCDGGFRRLLRDGRVYANSQYSVSGVDCASSIATIYTGTSPYNHGIISREWLDRASLRPVYCVDDFKYKGVETSQCSSPKNLLVSTIGDELKMATQGRGLVYSVSPFRESAVLSCGHAGDCAFWIDDRTGQWASSSYYGKSPSWYRYLSSISVSSQLPKLSWRPFSTSVSGYNYFLMRETKADFNHSFTGDSKYAKFKKSGLVNEEVTKAAKCCIVNGMMGCDGVPDILSVTYYAGTFDNKPFSESSSELQDTYVRLDREIEKLLQTLDSSVGLDNVMVFVTSTGYDDAEDDGNYETYRIPTGNFAINRCAALLNMYLTAIYGAGQYVDAYYKDQIYLNHKLIEQKQLNLSSVMECCEDFLFQFSGVRDVYTAQRITQGAWTPGISRIRNGYNPKCSGDVTIQVTPGWKLVNEDLGTSVVQRDSFVEFPLILFGYGIKSERINTETSVERVAPTMAHFMRIRAPNACSDAPLSDVLN